MVHSNGVLDLSTRVKIRGKRRYPTASNFCPTNDCSVPTTHVLTTTPAVTSLGNTAQPINTTADTSSLALKKCSVVLSDLPTDALARVQLLEDQVTKLKNELASLNKTVAILAPLSSLMDPHDSGNPTALKAAGNLLSTIASEISERIKRSCNVIIFNVPDRLSLDTVKHLILSICGLPVDACSCKRLMKRSIKRSCPIIFTFRSPELAKCCLLKKHEVRLGLNFGPILIKPDETPIQRASDLQKKAQKMRTSPKESLPTSTAVQSAPLPSVDLDLSPPTVSMRSTQTIPQKHRKRTRKNNRNRSDGASTVDTPMSPASTMGAITCTADSDLCGNSPTKQDVSLSNDHELQGVLPHMPTPNRLPKTTNNHSYTAAVTRPKTHWQPTTDIYHRTANVPRDTSFYAQRSPPVTQYRARHQDQRSSQPTNQMATKNANTIHRQSIPATPETPQQGIMSSHRNKSSIAATHMNGTYFPTTSYGQRSTAPDIRRPVYGQQYKDNKRCQVADPTPTYRAAAQPSPYDTQRHLQRQTQNAPMPGSPNSWEDATTPERLFLLDAPEDNHHDVSNIRYHNANRLQLSKPIARLSAYNYRNTSVPSSLANHSHCPYSQSLPIMQRLPERNRQQNTPFLWDLMKHCQPPPAQQTNDLALYHLSHLMNLASLPGSPLTAPSW